MATKAEIEHITNAVIGEAIDEGRKGWEAVANVIANRVDDSRYPGTVTGVLDQKTSKKGTHFAFSTFNTRARRGTQHIVAQLPASKRAEVRAVVEDVFAGKVADVTKGATSYGTPEAVGAWHKDQGLVATIGGHEFYGKTVGAPETGIRGPAAYAGMQAPIDEIQTASFQDPNAVGIPEPADRADQFSSVQVASMDPMAGFYAAAAQQTPETTAKGIMTSGVLDPAVEFSPTAMASLSGLLSPPTEFTAPAQIGPVDPHEVTTTNPAGIDGVARSTGVIGTPTQAQRGATQVASIDPGFYDGMIDAIDVPGSITGPMSESFGRRQGSLAPEPSFNAPAQTPSPADALGVGSATNTGHPYAAASAAFSSPADALGPPGAWRGVDMSNLNEPAIGPGTPPQSVSEQPSYSSPADALSNPAVSSFDYSSPAEDYSPQRSWGAASSITAAPVGAVQGSPMDALTTPSMQGAPTSAGHPYAAMDPYSSMVAAMDPHAPDPTTPEATAGPIGAPMNIQPGIVTLEAPRAATPTNPQTSFKDIAKGIAKGAMVGGWPGAVAGGVLAANPGMMSGVRGAAQTAFSGMADAIGGAFTRSPDYAGIQAGAYGAGGMPGNGTYGINGTSRGMGGFEQFGESFAGPGSGGWADAGQGFGRGSAADSRSEHAGGRNH